jgi:hypothetical protein
MLLLSACACQDDPALPIRFADKPPLETVRKLEARLAREPCVGALDRWSRRYRYWVTDDRRLDKQAIVIGLAEAGHAGRPAGVYIEPVYWNFELEHSKFRAAFGIYDARRQVIRYWTCGIANTGPNIPPTLRPDLPM